MPDKRNSHSRHSNGQSKRLRPGQPAKCAKLDNRLEKRICAHIRSGLPYEACAALVGISKQTFYSWKNRGDSEPASRYGEFARAVETANAQAMRTLHSIVAASDPKFILERRFREYYGPPKVRTATEISGPDGRAIQTEAKEQFKVVISCTEPMPQFPIIDWKDWEKWEASDAKKDFDRWIAELNTGGSNNARP